VEADDESDEDDPDAADWIEDYRLDPYEAPILTRTEMGYAEESMRLLCIKGTFPYSWLTSADKLEEVELPTRESFYNILSESECTPKDHQHAQEVWRHFGCGDMGDYTFLYLATDILLLCDIYERFRRLTLLDYGLDPARFYTAGALCKIHFSFHHSLNIYIYIF